MTLQPRDNATPDQTMLPLAVGDVFLLSDMIELWRDRLLPLAENYAARKKVPLNTVVYQVVAVSRSGVSMRVGHLPTFTSVTKRRESLSP